MVLSFLSFFFLLSVCEVLFLKRKKQCGCFSYRSGSDEKPDSSDAKKYLMVLAHSLEVEEYQKFLNIMRDFRDKRFTPDCCFIVYSSNLLLIFVSQRKRKENIYLDAYCRIDRVECVEKVKMLLQGKPDLFLGFQDFLPKSLDAKDCCTYDKMSDYWDALNFICKIKVILGLYYNWCTLDLIAYLFIGFGSAESLL